MDSLSNLIKSLAGSFSLFIIIWSLWIGYEIGKEAKTNWFSEKPQQESSIVEKKIAHNDTQQINSKQD